MGVPLIQAYRVGRYIAGRKLRGVKRYPLVLMLETLFQCNLACAGCGKIDQPKEILKERMSLEDALRAVDECGAPMVSLPGGEPLIHKDMPQIVAGIVARRKFVYLCTNAILLAKHIDDYRPSPYLTLSIHLDGDRERHDESVCQEGVFDKAVAAIRMARERGFRVTANCTLFTGEDPERVARFFDEAMALGIEGITVSPGYSYHHAPRQDVFLGRNASKRLFREIFKRRGAAAGAAHAAAGRSIIPGCSSISWRATKTTSARPGARPPTTFSAGSGPAICSPTRATRPASARSWRIPSGTSTAWERTPPATTAWPTAASRARPWTMPSPPAQGTDGRDARPAHRGRRWRPIRRFYTAAVRRARWPAWQLPTSSGRRVCRGREPVFRCPGG